MAFILRLSIDSRNPNSYPLDVTWDSIYAEVHLIIKRRLTEWSWSSHYIYKSSNLLYFRHVRLGAFLSHLPGWPTDYSTRTIYCSHTQSHTYWQSHNNAERSVTNQEYSICTYLDLSDKKHFVVPFDYSINKCHLYTWAVSLFKMKTHCYEKWANIKVYCDNMADNFGISSAK